MSGARYLAGAVALLLAAGGGPTHGEELRINTLRQLAQRMKQCWKPPAQDRSRPGIEITVMVSFTRDGKILGEPRITYESQYATDDDRLLYRTAVAEALQRCTPMPFTKELGDALAGHLFRFRFDDRRTKSTEKRSWQTTRTL